MKTKKEVANALQIPKSILEAFCLAVSGEEKNQQFIQNIEATKDSVLIGDYAKLISSENGFVIGRNKFFKWLKFERLVKNNNKPYQKYIDMGWLKVKGSTYEDEYTNGPQVAFSTRITGKGQIAIFKRFYESESFKEFLNKAARANKKYFEKVQR